MRGAYAQTLIYFGTIALSQGVSFLLLPIVTNYLSRELYGEYQLALTISSLVNTLGYSWIKNVGFRLYFDAKDQGKTRSFFVTVVLFQTVLVFALYAFALLTLDAFSVQLASTGALLAAGLSIVCSDLFGLSEGLMRAERQSSQFAVAQVGSALLRFAGTLGGLLIGFRSPALLFLAAAAATAIPGLYGALALQTKLSGRLFLDVELVRNIVRVGPASIPFSISGWFEKLADRLILEFFAGTAVVGLYSAGYALADRIINGITTAVFMMAWPSILHAWSDRGRAGAARAVRQALRLFFWLTLGPLVFVVLFPEQLARLLLGADFQEAANVVPIIVVGAWLSGLTVYFNRHYELSKRFGTFSLITAIGAATNVALNLVFVPRFGAVGAAWATLGGYIVNAGIFFALRDRAIVHLPYRDMVGSLALTALAWLASMTVPEGSPIQALVFVAVYALGVVALLLVSERPWRSLGGRPRAKVPSGSPTEAD